MTTTSLNRWFASLVIFVIGAVVVLSAGSRALLAQQTNRVWTDNSGTFSVKAKLVKANESSVTLLKLNGVQIEVPFERLSKLDIQFVEKQNRQSNQTNQPQTAKQKELSSETPPAHRAIPPPVETLDVQPATPFPKTLPEADKRPANKPGGRNNNADVKKDDRNEVKASLPDATGARTETGLKSLPNSVAELSLEVSPRDMERIPEPYQTMAWQISNVNNREAVREGLTALRSDWPKQRIPTLLKLLKRLAQSPDAKTRKQVVDLLAENDAKESFEIVLAGIEDKNFFVRWTSYEWIEKLRDKRAIAPLTRMLESDDPDLAATTLVAFGAVAEPHVLPLIKHELSGVQVTACSLLSKIGTSRSVASLESTANNASSVKVRMQASNAVEEIKKRQQQVD